MFGYHYGSVSNILHSLNRDYVIVLMYFFVFTLYCCLSFFPITNYVCRLWLPWTISCHIYSWGSNHQTGRFQKVNNVITHRICLVFKDKWHCWLSFTFIQESRVILEGQVRGFDGLEGRMNHRMGSLVIHPWAGYQLGADFEYETQNVSDDLHQGGGLLVQQTSVVICARKKHKGNWLRVC